MNTGNIGCLQYCEKRKYKLIFQFISAVFIPVLLGVFTVIFTIQQESIAQTNRDVDLRIATERYQQKLALAIDEQCNAQLVAYIREVSDLLLAKFFIKSFYIMFSMCVCAGSKVKGQMKHKEKVLKSYYTGASIYPQRLSYAGNYRSPKAILWG